MKITMVTFDIDKGGSYESIWILSNQSKDDEYWETGKKH